MNFINFESATEKERIRNEIRNAREEMLKKAKKNAEARAEYEANKKLKGENTWMHPSLSDKLKKMMKEHKRSSKNKKKDKEKTKKKNKKSKKGSKNKKRKHSSSNSSSDSESSSSTEEEIIKKKKKKRRKSSSSSSSSSDSETEGEEDEWVEKNMTSTTTTVPKKTYENLIRDNWMTEGQLLLKTYSKDNNAEERKDKNKPDTYDPTKSSRELNPHWRDGGKGIPTFQRPREDDDDFSNTNYYANNRKSFSSSSSGNWRKNNKSNERNTEDRRESDISRHKNEKYERNRNDSGRKNRKDSYSDDNNSENDSKKDSSEDFLTDQQMNDLGAKLIKAEIMGNEELIKELKEKLEKAREIRKNIKEKAKNCQPSTSSSSKNKNNRSEKEEHILLTTTNSKGMTKPLSRSTTKHPLSHDPYGGRKANKRKEKVETHIDGERIRYFPDDDRYDIKQMFEREKYVTGHDSDAQFIEIAGKHKNPKDDLEDIFADKVRKSISDYDRDEKEKKRAIIEHERYNKVLESCEKCFDSPKMEKGLMVAMGTTSYLSIPYHVGLQAYHCCITPMQHITCSTQLDEDTWNEITEFRKALTRMFSSISKDVIFFEIANYLHKKPHMIIHCVASENFEMAPMYFKKAIQESEYEWSTNKQLITLKDKDLRRSIPKGLPYFWVNFGMDLGFAHVIEDQHKFKSNFAQEIIGGILQLNHKSWRKPRKEQDFVEKVKQLAELWKPFDFTS